MLVIVHLVSPLIIFFLKDYFSPQIFLGLIIASTIPAGRSAVFLSNIYGGVPLKALVSTSISNFFSPLLVPLFVWVFAHTTININPAEMSWAIIYLVMIPLILAVLFGKSKLGQQLNQYSPSLSIVILFFIILGIISPLKSVVTDNLQLSLILGVLISVLIIIDFCLGYLLGHNHPQKITYAISSSYKNYTLATLLSLTVFTPIVALPAIIYTVISNLLLIPLQMFLHTSPKSNSHLHHKQRNLIMLTIGIVGTIILSRSPVFASILNLLTPFPLLASFIGGMLFASTFTLATGGLILIKLSSHYSPILLTIFGALGAVSCDAVIFYFFKNKVASHISPTYQHLINHSPFHKILHTHYFAWTLPVVGAFILASPLPDELAVSLMGITKINSLKFFTVALVSHFIGVSTIIASSKIF